MARRIHVSKGKTFTFVLDMGDLIDEYGKFAKRLKEDLPKELESKRTTLTMKTNVVKRLSDITKAKTSSNRVSSIIEAIKKKDSQTYYSRPAPGAKRIGRGAVPPIVGVHIGRISELDSQTRISALDAKFPPKHNAPFAGNPFKTTGQASKTRKHLWRLYEFNRRKSYPISSKNSYKLFYTKESDGFSKWHVTKQVTWKMNKKQKAYFFLDKSRHVYKSEREIFKRNIIRGVSKIIKSKTRFKK